MRPEQQLPRFVDVVAQFARKSRAIRGVQVSLGTVPPNQRPAISVVVDIESDRPEMRTHYRAMFDPGCPSEAVADALIRGLRHHERELRSFAASLLMRDESLIEEA